MQGSTQFKLNEAERLSAVLGLSMYERDCCFFEEQNRREVLARRADELALQLKAALRSAGCEFYLDSCTNQQFLLVSPAQADFLAQRCIFEPLGTWPDGRQCVRLCTSWSTAPARIEALCHELRQLPRA